VKTAGNGSALFIFPQAASFSNLIIPKCCPEKGNESLAQRTEGNRLTKSQHDRQVLGFGFPVSGS
jgi:hypothetical protein